MVAASGAETDAPVASSSGAPLVVLRCEDRAEEWHYDEVSHAAAVQALDDRHRVLREREAAAHERAKSVEREAEAQTEALLEAAKEEDLRLAGSLSRMRGELLEAQEVTEQLKEDCELQVAEAQKAILAEQERRKALEAELLMERRQAEEARRRINEIEKNELHLMREKERRINEKRTATQREIVEVQNVAEEEVRGQERRLQQDLKVLQKQLDEALAQAKVSVEGEVQRRQEALTTADLDISGVDRRIREKLGATHEEILDLHENAVAKAQDAQARDFALEALLREEADAAMAAVGCASDEKKQAAMLERENRQRSQAAVKALGETFPRSTQYQLHFDKKTRSSLATSARSVVPGAE